MIKKNEKTTLARLVGFALMCSSTAYASDYVDPASVSVDENQAVSIANSQVAGSLIDTELESENDRSLWEVQLLTTSGQTVEVSIDANTGEVISTENDGDGDDADEDEDEDEDDDDDDDTASDDNRL